MSQILITGGCGFIGSHVAEFYAKQDEDNQVFIVDSLYKDTYINRGKTKFYIKNYLEKYPNITFIHRDVRNLERIKEVLYTTQPEFIFHLAGQVATTTSVLKPYLDFDMNVRGTFSLLEAIRQLDLNPTFIYSSTNKVYGDRVNTKLFEEKEKRYEFKCCNGINEKDNIDQTIHSPYGTSKLCADLYVQEYGYTYGLRTGVFRMSCIYGSRQMGYEDQGWIVHFILSALRNREIQIYGNGKQVRDILYIDDLVKAYNSFVIKKKFKNEVFTMGGGIDNTISLLECIEIIESILKKKIKYSLHDWRLADQKIYISDINKAHKYLGWKPEINARDGLGRTVKWFQDFLKNDT